ncbi:MAG: N-formylglutamate amidohydrolase [Nanoarchaeota archaeon]|nr:N-formylglutamate amidohydrolase [Nanoarchaeota archaeon]MBU1703887.1 N-formylglutamate amidohydrolase [Nanoarchaeota archaeon]
MEKIKDVVRSISPVLIKPGSSSITIGLSKRFFLFRIMNKIVSLIEEDPHLNFVALLKSYKILGRFLSGTLHEFYRDRNKLYFKNFFIDRKLYNMVKADIEHLYPKYLDTRMTITKRGVIIYDNYKKSSFNTLLLTIHSGSWVPVSIGKKLSISEEQRLKEEDIETNRIYSRIVLEKAGIWIDSKQSRFVIDFNRSLERAIYADNSEEWLDVVWKEKLTKHESDEIYRSYREFYFTLSKLIDTFNFNIIFDGHSMKALDGRPNISFGTKFIPHFYMPIVRSMQRKMISMGYSPVLFDTPYHGGYILRWLNQKFPNIFIFSIEINKKLYMLKNGNRPIKKRINKLAEDLTQIFDIEDEINK